MATSASRPCSSATTLRRRSTSASSTRPRRRSGIEAIDHRLPATTTEDELVELVEASERGRLRRRDPRADAAARADRRGARDAGDRSDEGRRRAASVQRRPALPRPPDPRPRDTARCHAPARRVQHPDRRASAPWWSGAARSSASRWRCSSCRRTRPSRSATPAPRISPATPWTPTSSWPPSAFPDVITADMVKQGATVIDVGITRTDAGLRGTSRATSPRWPPSSRRFRAASAR